MSVSQTFDAVRPLSRSEYIRVLRPILPREAFAPAPYKLWWIALHLVIIGAGYVVFRFSDNLFLCLFDALIIGNCLGCLAFFAHETSHNSIVRNYYIKRALELLLWGLNMFSPTLWHRIHNQTHHAHPNGMGDPDRKFISGELPFKLQWLVRFSYPSRYARRWLPTPLLSFTTYILIYTVTALYRVDIRPATRPTSFPGDRLIIAGELGVILLMQVGVFFAVGGHWLAYLCVGPLPCLISSMVVMAYILTNHFLKPLCESNDPLVSTTSVQVPAVLNWLHSNFSFHTEHHIFPMLNSDYYPLVSKLLRESYPDHYHQLRFGEAWRQLWEQDEFLDLFGGFDRSIR